MIICKIFFSLKYHKLLNYLIINYIEKNICVKLHDYAGPSRIIPAHTYKFKKITNLY